MQRQPSPRMLSAGVLCASILAHLFPCGAMAFGQTTYHVNTTTGNDTWSGLAPTWDGTDGPKRTIQAGIDSATSGDEVVIAPGLYTGDGNRDLDFSHGLPEGQTRAITVRSVDPEDHDVVAATVIDCQGTEQDPHRGFTFHSAETRDSVVAGITITNGYPPEHQYYFRSGGAIFCNRSSPTVRNCIIRGNHAPQWGGGIFGQYSYAAITDCALVDNNAGYGGALWGYGGAFFISNCTFSGNIADKGGGVSLHRDNGSSLVACIISGNSAVWNGGGMDLSAPPGSRITVANSIITHNTAERGGAVFFETFNPEGTGRAELRIDNCTVSRNSASDYAGAIFVSCARVFLWNSILRDDVAQHGSEIAMDCFEASHPPPELFCWAELDAHYNNISGGEEGIYLFDAWCSTVSYDGVDVDPLFVAPDGADGNPHTWEDNDYHLRTESPCIDAGSDGAVSADLLTDIDGDPRIVDARPGTPNDVDMGADECVAPVSMDIGYEASAQVWVDWHSETCDTLEEPVDCYYESWSPPEGYPASARSRAHLMATHGGWIRGSIHLSADDGLECDGPNPEDFCFPMSSDTGGSVVLNGTLVLGVSEGYPEGSDLELSLEVTSTGYPSGIEEYYLKLWREGALLAEVSPTASEPSTIGASAGETYTFELFARSSTGDAEMPEGLDRIFEFSMVLRAPTVDRRADLTVRSLTPSEGVPTEGEVVTWTAVIRNVGDAAAGPFDVALYDGAPSSGSPLIGQPQTISSLLPESEVELAFEWNTLGLLGSHNVHFVADEENQVEESDENNNLASVDIVVGQPVLVLDIVGSTNALPGERVDYQLRVNNIGARQATNLMLTVEIPEPLATEECGPGQSCLTGWAWATLEAGESRQFDMSGTVAFGTPDNTEIVLNCDLTFQNKLGADRPALSTSHITVVGPDEQPPIIGVKAWPRRLSEGTVVIDVSVSEPTAGEMLVAATDSDGYQVLVRTETPGELYSISVDEAIPEGPVNITASAPDLAGNTGEGTGFVDVDHTPPDLTIDAPPVMAVGEWIARVWTNEVLAGPPSLAATDAGGEPMTTAYIGPVPEGHRFNVIVTAETSQGLAVLKAAAIDLAGLSAVVQQQVTIDSTVPTIEIAGPDLIGIGTASYVITPTESALTVPLVTFVDASGEIYWAAYPDPDPGSESFFFDLPIFHGVPNGTGYLSVTIEDFAGNWASAEKAIVVDTLGPTFEVAVSPTPPIGDVVIDVTPGEPLIEPPVVQATSNNVDSIPLSCSEIGGNVYRCEGNDICTLLVEGTDLVGNLGRASFGFGDLGVANEDLDFDGTPATGNDVEVSLVVHNHGPFDVRGAKVAFYRGLPTLGRRIGSEQVIDVAAGGETRVSAIWLAEDQISSYSVYGVVDSTNEIPESNEANNQAVRASFTLSATSDRRTYVLDQDTIALFSAQARSRADLTVLGPPQMSMSLQVVGTKDDPITMLWNDEYQRFEATLDVGTDLALGAHELQVTAVDSTTETEVTRDIAIEIVRDFTISLTVPQSVYNLRDLIELSGDVIDLDGTPIRRALVAVTVQIGDAERTTRTSTDDQGRYQIPFELHPAQAGTARATAKVWRGDRIKPSGQIEFSILGLYMEPVEIRGRMWSNAMRVVPIQIRNVGDDILTDLIVYVTDSAPDDGIGGVGDAGSMETSLNPGEVTFFDLRISSAPDAAGQKGELHFSITSAEGGLNTGRAQIAVMPGTPDLRIEPPFLEFVLQPGDRAERQVVLSNHGTADMEDVAVAADLPDWIRFGGRTMIGRIAGDPGWADHGWGYLRHLGIIARVDDGPAFDLESLAHLTIEQSGHLWMRVNEPDGALADNSGTVSVRVEILGSNTVHSVAVLADRGWQDSGILVEAGEQVSMRTSGLWRVDTVSMRGGNGYGAAAFDLRATPVSTDLVLPEPYNLPLTVSSSNSDPLNIPLTIWIRSADTGNAIIHVTDEANQNLESAMVVLYSQVYDPASSSYPTHTTFTNVSGNATLRDLAIGPYRYQVTDANDRTAHGSLLVYADEDTVVEAAIANSGLLVTWTVDPIDIIDGYAINVDTWAEPGRPALWGEPICREFLPNPGEHDTEWHTLRITNIGDAVARNVLIKPPHYYPYTDHEVLGILVRERKCFLEFNAATTRFDEIRPGETVTVMYVAGTTRESSSGEFYPDQIQIESSYMEMGEWRRLIEAIPVVIRTPGNVLKIDPWVVSVIDYRTPELIGDWPPSGPLYIEPFTVTNVGWQPVTRLSGVGAGIIMASIEFSPAVFRIENMFLEGAFKPDSLAVGESAVCQLQETDIWGLISPDYEEDDDSEQLLEQEQDEVLNIVDDVMEFVDSPEELIEDINGFLPGIGFGLGLFSAAWENRDGSAHTVWLRYMRPGFLRWIEFPFEFDDSETTIPGSVGPIDWPKPNGEPRAPIPCSFHLNQHLTVERSAFAATLEVINGSIDYPAEDVRVDIEVRDDETGAVVVLDHRTQNDLLFFAQPTLNGIEDVDGDSVLGFGQRFSAHWTVIPTVGAAGDAPEGKVYRLRVRLAYRFDNKAHITETHDELITVLPQPQLSLTYYVPRFVEGGIPFDIWVQVANVGRATARHLRIDDTVTRDGRHLPALEINPGAPAEIQDILTSLRLIGGKVRGQPFSHSLVLDFGDLSPGASVMGAWRLRVDDDLEITACKAGYKHDSALGGAETSLITGEIVSRLVDGQIIDDSPQGDDIEDLLVDLNNDDVPDALLSGVDGQPGVVTFVPAVVAQSATPGEPLIQFTAPDGSWIYTIVPNSLWTTHAVARIIRDDGSEIDPRNFREKDSQIHLVDWQSGAYTVALSLLEVNPVLARAEAGPDTWVYEGLTLRLNATGSVNASTVRWDQLAGYPIVFDDVNSSTPAFVAPAPPDGEQLLFSRSVLALEAIINEGAFNEDRDSLSVKVRMLGDANGDDCVMLIDKGIVESGFGSTPGDLKWNPAADMDGDERITTLDRHIVLSRLGMCRPDALWPDFDHDWDVDLDDHVVFVDCIGGPAMMPGPMSGMTPQECLETFDLDADADVDMSDWRFFQGVFTNAARE